MYSNTADCSSRRDGQLRRLTSSFFSVAKNVSATALSYASPREPIETAIPASPAARPNASDTYLRALVGVVDQPGVRSSARERHLERVDDQASAHVGGHRPAPDLPGGPVRVG